MKLFFALISIVSCLSVAGQSTAEKVLENLEKQKQQQRAEQALKDSLAKAKRDSIYKANPRPRLVKHQPADQVEPSFISAYGTGYRGMANIEGMRMAGNPLLTPFTYVDFNYVYDRVNDYMRYTLRITEQGDGPAVGDGQIVSKYKGAQGTLTITYEVGDHEGFYYIRSARITGARYYLDRFFLWYWPHGFNDAAIKDGELLAYTYLLDRVAYQPGSSPYITVENTFNKRPSGLCATTNC